MLAILTAVLPIFWKIGPLLITLFVRDKQARAAALDQFEDFRSKHENDGLLSAGLRTSAADQKNDLAMQALARDEAEKLATQAALAQTVAPAPVVSSAGQAGPTGNVGAPQPTPFVPVPLTGAKA